jgi:aspartyl-tRNA(Asn)/glutamyl-tRNA(Gln) amidotransferase subunit C
MAKLSRDDVLKLARLARLRLNDEEVIAYQKELSAILEYVAHLDAVDTAGLEPTYQVTGLTNVARADVVKDYGMSQKELLKNVPQKEGSLIKVRRMIG